MASRLIRKNMIAFAFDLEIIGTYWLFVITYPTNS